MNQSPFTCHHCTGTLKHVQGCPEIERLHDEEIKQWNQAVLKLHEEKRWLAEALKPFTLLNPRSPRVAGKWGGFVKAAREALGE